MMCGGKRGFLPLLTPALWGTGAGHLPARPFYFSVSQEGRSPSKAAS